MEKQFLKPIADKSIKTNLLAIANFAFQEAEGDKVPARKEAFIKVGKALMLLAEGRYVTRLLNYME